MREGSPRVVAPTVDSSEERAPILRSSLRKDRSEECRSVQSLEAIRFAAEADPRAEERTAAVKTLGYALVRSSSPAESILIEQTLLRRARFDVDPGVRELAARILRAPGIRKSLIRR